jgi:hypothetical protein
VHATTATTATLRCVHATIDSCGVIVLVVPLVVVLVVTLVVVLVVTLVVAVVHILAAVVSVVVVVVAVVVHVLANVLVVHVLAAVAVVHTIIAWDGSQILAAAAAEVAKVALIVHAHEQGFNRPKLAHLWRILTPGKVSECATKGRVHAHQALVGHGSHTTGYGPVPTNAREIGHDRVHGFGRHALAVTTTTTV